MGAVEDHVQKKKKRKRRKKKVKRLGKKEGSSIGTDHPVGLRCFKRPPHQKSFSPKKHLLKKREKTEIEGTRKKWHTRMFPQKGGVTTSPKKGLGKKDRKGDVERPEKRTTSQKMMPAKRGKKGRGTTKTQRVGQEKGKTSFYPSPPQTRQPAKFKKKKTRESTWPETGSKTEKNEKRTCRDAKPRPPFWGKKKKGGGNVSKRKPFDRARLTQGGEERWGES